MVKIRMDLVRCMEIEFFLKNILWKLVWNFTLFLNHNSHLKEFLLGILYITEIRL